MSNYSDATVAERLREATNLLKSGNKVAAKPLIASVLKEDSRHAHAWYLAAYVYDDPERKIKALETALSINPNHAEAQKALAKLRPDDDLDDLLDSAAPIPSKPKRTQGYEDPSILLAREKNYTNAAVIVFVLYFFFWLPGVIVNFMYLSDANRTEEKIGEPPPGKGALKFMSIVFGWIPLIAALFVGVVMLIALLPIAR